MMDLRTYSDALRTHAANAKAAKTESLPVIQRWAGAKETPEWLAWIAYWKKIGARGTLEIVEGRTSWTVPTMLPWEFDAGYYG